MRNATLTKSSEASFFFFPFFLAHNVNGFQVMRLPSIFFLLFSSFRSVLIFFKPQPARVPGMYVYKSTIKT